MSLARTILAALLIILGIMVENISTEVSHLAQRIESLPAPMILQSATARISKPRVPAVKHIYNKAPTIIDRIGKP